MEDNNLGTNNSGIENSNPGTDGITGNNTPGAENTGAGTDNTGTDNSGKEGKNIQKRNAKPTVTLESLHAMFTSKFDEQEKTIANLQLQLAAKKGTEIGAAAAKAIPSIPANLVKAQGKAYKWNLAHFVMPGTSIVFTAEEANQSPELIAAILALPGQQVLNEQV